MHKTEGAVEWRTTRGSKAPLCLLKQTPASWRQIQNAPRGTTPMPLTGSGIHGKRLVPNVLFSNNMCAVSKQAGRFYRDERASRLLELLSAPHGKALLEDFDPCRWRMRCNLVVEDFQDAILLSNNLLDGPPCVQRRCGIGLAPGKESCDCRKQIGQGPRGLLWTLSRHRIHFNKDVDCGRQGEDVEDVDVVVLHLRPSVSKVQELKEKNVLRGGRSAVAGHAGSKRIFAWCTSARLRVEVALEITPGKSPTPVRTSRRWTDKIPRDLRREHRAQGHAGPRGTIARAEANCPVRAEVSNQRLDGCRDADG